MLPLISLEPQLMTPLCVKGGAQFYRLVNGDPQRTCARKARGVRNLLGNVTGRRTVGQPAKYNIRDASARLVRYVPNERGVAFQVVLNGQIDRPEELG